MDLTAVNPFSRQSCDGEPDANICLVNPSPTSGDRVHLHNKILHPNPFVSTAQLASSVHLSQNFLHISEGKP